MLLTALSDPSLCLHFPPTSFFANNPVKDHNFVTCVISNVVDVGLELTSFGTKCLARSCELCSMKTNVFELEISDQYIA